MIIELIEYEIKEAVVLWIEKKGLKLNIKYLPTDVVIRPDKGTGYTVEVETHEKT